MMERHLELRETQALYQVGIDAAELEHEPVVLKKNGKPVAAVISYDEFQSFKKWKKQTRRRKAPAYFLKDEALFFKLLPELLETHRGKWIAIYRGKIVDEADSTQELTKRVYGKYGYRAIYMSQVAEPRVYHIPSVWVKHR